MVPLLALTQTGINLSVILLAIRDSISFHQDDQSRLDCLIPLVAKKTENLAMIWAIGPMTSLVVNELYVCHLELSFAMDKLNVQMETEWEVYVHMSAILDIIWLEKNRQLFKKIS